MAIGQRRIDFSRLIFRPERPHCVSNLKQHHIGGRFEHIAVAREVKYPSLEPGLLVFVHLVASERLKLSWRHIDVTLPSPEYCCLNPSKYAP